MFQSNIVAARYRRRLRVALVGWSCALILAFLAAFVLGPMSIHLEHILESLVAHATNAESPLTPLEEAVLWQARVPRSLTAAAVGGGLALCGACLQGLTRNPLADPYLLGISSGASVGAVIVAILGVSIAMPIAAFGGALVALFAAMFIAKRYGSLTSLSLILAGLAISAGFSAITSLIIFWHATGDSYREILSWLLGSFSGASWSDFGIAGSALLICCMPMLLAARQLDAIALGETAAEALGIAVQRTRLILLISSALLTGALVAVSGAIGFVGLVFPHIVRRLVGPLHVHLLPVSFIAGATFLVVADTAARTIFDPRELPVGIITSLIGGPMLAALLLKRPDASYAREMRKVVE